MMIEEVKRNPAHAAELIYLASEIRKGTGDESALSDILVEYIEKLGERMARDADNSSPEGAAHLKKVMTDVESTILKKLSHMNVNTTLLVRMEERLNARMESILDGMRVQWLNSRTSQEKVKMLSVLQTLEHNVSQDEILAPILKAVRARVDAGEIEENNYSQIHEEIIRQKQANDALVEEKGIPEGVLDAEEIMFILDKEIARAQRYGSFFSALAFAFVSAKPTTKHQKGTVTQEAVLDAALYKLSTIIRQVDYIGQVGKNKMIVLLPMIAREEARKALSRILRLLHASPLNVCGVSVDLRVAGVMTDFDHEKMPDAKAFTKQINYQLTDMVARLKSIQVLF
jgi:GGDEF domain-containing protein